MSDLNTYTLFVLAESKYTGCRRLADIMENLSHDSVNKFLLRERYETKDLFEEIKPNINLIGGTLSGDDTVIDKPHSDPKITELIGFYYSGRHHLNSSMLNQFNQAMADLTAVVEYIEE